MPEQPLTFEPVIRLIRGCSYLTTAIAANRLGNLNPLPLFAQTRRAVTTVLQQVPSLHEEKALLWIGEGSLVRGDAEEERIEGIDSDLSKPGLSSEALQDLMRDRAALAEDLEQAETDWLEATEAYEELVSRAL